MSGLYEGVLKYRVNHVKYLLSHGIDINFLNDAGRGVLFAALSIPNDDKRRKMFNFLMRNGADYQIVDKLADRSILQWACFLDRTDQVKKLVDFSHGDLDFRRKDLHGHTALHLAVKRGNEDIVWALCREMSRLGVTVDIIDREGLTPYLRAQREGRGRIASILVQDGGASRLQFDTVTFRTSLEWSEYGRKERKKEADAHIQAMLRLNGKEANIRQLRGERGSIHGQKLEALQHKHLSKLSTHETTSSVTLSNGHLSSPFKLPRLQIQVTLPSVTVDPPDGASVGTAPAASLASGSSSQLPPLAETPRSNTSDVTNVAESPGPLHDVKRPQAEEMKDILDVLATQMSPSFRKQAVAPVISHPGMGQKRVSTLAIIMNRHKSRRQQNKLQNAVQAMLKSNKTKDRKQSGGKGSLLAAVSLINKRKVGVKANGQQEKVTLALPAS